MEPDNIKSEIEILVAQKPVNILLDNCNCIKLVRNTFSDLGEMKDGDGETIQWCFIARLYELQSMELCHLANKITRNHVFWQNLKMKVKLAIQVFSRSTADAIDYCREVLKLSQFQGSSATTRFLRMFDEIFDLLNSTSKFGKRS